MALEEILKIFQGLGIKVMVTMMNVVIGIFGVEGMKKQNLCFFIVKFLFTTTIHEFWTQVRNACGVIVSLFFLPLCMSWKRQEPVATGHPLEATYLQKVLQICWNASGLYVS